MLEAANLNTDPRQRQSPSVGRTPGRASNGFFCLFWGATLSLLLVGCTGDTNLANEYTIGENSSTSQKHTPENLTTCPEERPEMCTQQYDPVCGYFYNEDETESIKKTFGNGCSACADSNIEGYVDGECPK